MSKWIVVAAVALSLALAIALRIKSDTHVSKKDAVQHYFNVDEVVASPDFDHVVRVHGRVVPNSVHARQDRELTFRIALKGESIEVHYHGVLPDLFRDNSECIATGELSRDGDRLVLDATDVIAKTPSF